MTSKPDVLEIGRYPDWDRAPMEASFTVHRLHMAADPVAFLAEVGPRIRGIATRGDLGVTRAVLQACPKVEIVSVYGVGVDAVDLGYCRERCIRVGNTPGVVVADVADLAVAMALALCTRTITADAWARSGDWAAKGPIALRPRFSGRRAGILGLGPIGMAISDRLRAFGMEVAYSSRSEKPGTEGMTFLPDPVALAGFADFLFVAVAATPDTRHVVNAAVLEALGRDGFLVNISRAANVDEAALLDALEHGRIAGAALDVFEGEPAINPRFRPLANALLQPHHGTGTFETRRTMGEMVRANLLAQFDGRPLVAEVA
jgi:lactate dehydrogenase-like 2-hydroxyacid dehydrogenase